MFFTKLNVHSKTKFLLPIAARDCDKNFWISILLLHWGSPSALTQTHQIFIQIKRRLTLSSKDSWYIPGCPHSWRRCWWCRGPDRPRSWWPWCRSRGPPPSPSPGARCSCISVIERKYCGDMRQIFTSLRYHWCRASRPRGCYSWPGRRAESAPALWGLETCRERPAPTNWGEQTHKQLVSTLRRKPQEIKLAQRQLLLEDSKTLCRKDNFIEKILRLQYTYIYILQQYIFIHFRHYQFRSIINKLVYCLFVYTHSAVEYIRTSRLIFRY